MALLDLEQLSVGYGLHSILRDVSLHLGSGDVVAIFGDNGSGKSTLLRCIFGLLSPSTGRIRFDGRDVTSASILARQRAGMSYLFQGRRIFDDLTVEENLEVSLRAYSRNTLSRDALEMLGRFTTVKFDHGRKANGLSDGEAKILAFVCAILAKPRLLLMDEPTASLSPDSARTLLSILDEYQRQYGTTMLIVDHNRNEAMQIANRAVVVANGVVVDS